MPSPPALPGNHRLAIPFGGRTAPPYARHQTSSHVRPTSVTPLPSAPRPAPREASRSWRRSALRGAVWPAAALLLAGCSDPTGPGGAASVEVTGADEPLSALGETVQLQAEVRDAQANALPGAEIAWSSGDSAVASVDEEGVVTAEGEGTAEVEARAGEAVGAATITVSPRPGAMDAAAGNHQEGTVGEPLADSLVVEVRDGGGSPLAGQAVRFQVEAGEGAVSPEAVETDDDGRAAARWTLGEDASAPHRVVARTEDPAAVTTAADGDPAVDGSDAAADGDEALEADFEAMAHPGEPDALALASGGDQEGYALEPLADSLAVQVEDAFGNPVPDAEVAWEDEAAGGSEGAGTVEPNPAVSDSSGTARGLWTPGHTDGEVGLTIMVDGTDPISAMAQVEPNAVIHGVLQAEDAGRPLAELHRDVARWPRVPEAGFAETEESAPVAGEPRPLQALAGSEATSREAPPLGDAGQPKAGADGPRERELLVTFQEGIPSVPGLRTAAARDPERAAALALQLRDRFRELRPTPDAEVLGASPLLGTVRVAVPPDRDPDRFRQELLAVEDVERVTLNQEIHAFKASPADPLSDPGPINPLQLWHYRALDLERAWELEQGSPDIVVAVVDDGFRFEHPWLEDRWVSQGYSFVEEEELNRCGEDGTVSSTGHGEGPGPDATVPTRYQWSPSGQCVMERIDQGGHGMQVAGLLAGGAEGDIRGRGVAPGVRLLPIRALDVAGVGSAYGVAQAILYAAGLPADDGQGGTVHADEPANIINLSLGSPAADSLIHEAVKEAYDVGTLMVAAAGNQESAFAAYPAAHPEVMAVSAVDARWELAWYSNRGTAVEVTAPGGEAERGTDGLVWTSEWSFADAAPAFGSAQGTSMASPHVAGVAALVWSQDPSLDHEEVRRRVRENAYPLGPGRPNTLYGYGLLDAYWALTDGAGGDHAAHAILYDAESGQVVERTQANQGEDFRFTRLDPGRYWVYGGVGDADDLAAGRPPGPWAAAGQAGKPDTVTVEGSGGHRADVTLAPPVAAQDNDAGGSPEILPVGGYLSARLHNPTTFHEYRLPIPESGTYTVETTGVLGACGLAGSLDTELEVLDPDGGSLGTSSAVDESAGNHCSRLELHLDAGPHTVRVGSHDDRPGLYRIIAH